MTFEPNPLAVGVMAASMAPARTQEPMKYCQRCQEKKALDLFNKNRSTKDGLQGYCRKCTSELSRARNIKLRRSKAMKKAAQRKKQQAAIADPVNNPEHYKAGGIECIDAMVQVFGEEAVRTYARINAFKYQWRAPYKGKTAEDYKKALWYLRFADGDDPRKDRPNE